MACSSVCSTQDHATFGECLRAKNLQVADVTAHKFNQNQRREMDNYVKARYAGLQPETVFKRDVDHAWKETERTGVPFRADQ